MPPSDRRRRARITRPATSLRPAEGELREIDRPAYCLYLSLPAPMQEALRQLVDFLAHFANRTTGAKSRQRDRALAAPNPPAHVATLLRLVKSERAPDQKLIR